MGEEANRSSHTDQDAAVEPAEAVDLVSLRNLVLQAFAAAAGQRKPEWYKMHGTVLKNRLLDVTNRTFDESDYGEDRFLDVAKLLRGVLDVDVNAQPFVVELLEPYRTEVLDSAVSATGQWVRPDLWKAVLDYSTLGQWLWSPSRAAVVNAAESMHVDDGVPLPTLNADLLRQWRTEFADSRQQNLGESERLQVEQWSSLGLRTTALPKRLVSGWNELVRRRVLERLENFFEQHELEQPPDLVNSVPEGHSASQIRRFVLQCINLMNEAELREIAIPAHVAMRVRR